MKVPLAVSISKMSRARVTRVARVLDLVILVTLDFVLVYSRHPVILIFDSRSSYFYNQQSKL